MVKLGRDQVSFVNNMQVSFSFLYKKAICSSFKSIYNLRRIKKKIEGNKKLCYASFCNSRADVNVTFPIDDLVLGNFSC